MKKISSPIPEVMDLHTRVVKFSDRTERSFCFHQTRNSSVSEMLCVMSAHFTLKAIQEYLRHGCNQCEVSEVMGVPWHEA